MSGECIRENDYAHAQTVWREFGLQTLGQYHDLYVLIDVLYLADVFENFRNICLNYYGLDAAHFYISTITHRHAKANNKDVPDYDPRQTSSHVTYLDANNLYGWTMSQALPVDGFRWLEDQEIESLNVLEILTIMRKDIC